MLRRVAGALRIGLAALGLIFLLWLPVSLYVAAEVSRTRATGKDWYNLWISGGRVVASSTFNGLAPSLPGTWHGWVYWGPDVNRDVTPWEPALGRWLVPRTSSVSFYLPGGFAQPYTQHSLAIPLWLLAAACLAWPVTSFLLARRRRGRGFEVEVTIGS